MKPIPLCDLKAQHQQLETELAQAFADVIGQSAYIQGPFVRRFEQEFAALLGIDHCVSCACGTDALTLAMRALDLQPGDEVITSAHSWIATSEAITLAGGKPVFCDTRPDTFTLCALDVERRITPRTRGLLPVHLFGHPADMDALMAIARQHDLWVLEDCAQSHLAKWRERPTGTFGHAAAFSFYPGKNLGALGDAGAVVTADGALAERITRLARHGGLSKGEHLIEGANSRMDGLQAAFLLRKLGHLPGWNERRRSHARTYRRLLEGIPGLLLPVEAAHAHHVYHQFVIRVDGRRDALRGHLAARGIETGIHYPSLLPALPAYRHLGARMDEFPVALAYQDSLLSLPMYPELDEGVIERICEAVREGPGIS